MMTVVQFVTVVALFVTGHCLAAWRRVEIPALFFLS